MAHSAEVDGMGKMTKSLLAVAMGLAFLASGCGTNEAATKKCKEAQDCEACCKAAGATGHASGTVNGKYSCKCLGGG